jgi:hypothetical protein
MDIKNILTKPIIALSVSMFGAGYVFNNISSLKFENNSDFLMVLVLIVFAFIARTSTLKIVKFINSFEQTS